MVGPMFCDLAVKLVDALRVVPCTAQQIAHALTQTPTSLRD